MFWKIRYKKILKKGLNFYLKKDKEYDVKNVSNYIVGRIGDYFLLDINEITFWLYTLIFFLQKSLQQNLRFIFINRREWSPSLLKHFCEFVPYVSFLNRWGTKWIGGIISNFIRVRWVYIINNKPLFNDVPDLVIVLNRLHAESIIIEAFNMKLPLVLYSCYNWEDEEAAYLFYGATHTSPKRTNTIFFFSLLRQMFFLERSFKK